MATTKVIITGPVFDGHATEAAQAFVRSLASEIAEIGATWIKLDTQRMTRSGSDTGQAAGGVKVAGDAGNWVISGGISKGVYAWPWLEGTSKRNQGNQFKGYHSFRRTRLRMRKQVTPFAQREIKAFLAEIGGE
jgi:hypothetical protein